MTLHLEWTLEDRPRPLNVRVSAEVLGQRVEVSAADESGRPVVLTPEEESEVEELALERAADACGECGAMKCARHWQWRST